MENLIVRRNFMNLLSGDEIRVSTDSDGRIYFNVINRTRKVRFYGNENGRWGKDNPAPGDGRPTFILIDEPMRDQNVLIFGKIPPRPPHPTNELKYAEGTSNWEQIWMDKIINDLKSIGVF